MARVPVHRNKDAGTFMIDRRVRGIGRIKRASGTNIPEAFERIQNMITDAIRRNRHAVLLALQDGRLDPIDLIVPGPLRSFTPKPKVCYVYVIHRPATNEVKIGVSRKPKERMASLQTSCSSPLVLLAKIKGTQFEERLLHKQFAAHRKWGEWFEASPEILEWAKKPINPRTEHLSRVLQGTDT